MTKEIYKVLDEKGRVLIPIELRKKADMEKGDILKLSVSNGKLQVVKVDIVDPGKQEPAMVEAYVNAAIKNMSHEKQIELAAKLLEYAGEDI